MKILPPLQEEDSMIAGLSYPFWYIVSWLVLLSQKREEPFVKFHAIQSIAFGVFTTFCSIVLTLLLWGAFQLVPSKSKMIMGEFIWKGYMWKGLFFVILFTLFCLALCVFWIIVMYYAYKAYRGEYFKIHLIGDKIEHRYFRYLDDEGEVKEVCDASTRIIPGRTEEVTEREMRDTSTRLINQLGNGLKGKESPDASGKKYIVKRFDDSRRDDRF